MYLHFLVDLPHRLQICNTPTLLHIYMGYNVFNLYFVISQQRVHWSNTKCVLSLSEFVYRQLNTFCSDGHCRAKDQRQELNQLKLSWNKQLPAAIPQVTVALILKLPLLSEE